MQAVNQQKAGSDFFQKFVNDIFPMSYPAAQALAKHLNVAGSDKPVRVLDLAAGSGVWGIALAQSSRTGPCHRGRLAGCAASYAENRGPVWITERFSFVEGDLLIADFGSDQTIATLGHILHSEGEERSRALLAKTFNALATGGTIAIAEFLVNPERTGPLNGLFFAVNMLVNTESGNTYSFEEIGGWLRDAGFVNARTIDSPGPSPLILANKP